MMIEENQIAWVVFTGKTEIWWLKLLRPGYRHCFALLNDGQRWMSVDPVSPYTDIQIYHHLSPGFDLPKWLQLQGHVVVKSFIEKNHQKPAPSMLFTCVEAVKRILGIHRRSILTPWQLYQFLKNNNKQII